MRAGRFQPFGDITTLMVWQKGKLEFFEFFALFLPSLVNWLVPAALMYFAVPKGKPPARAERVRGKPGMMGVVVLFALTIATAVRSRISCDLPPALGMMLGLGYLQIWSYFLQHDAATRRKRRRHGAGYLHADAARRMGHAAVLLRHHLCRRRPGRDGLSRAGSEFLYAGLGPTTANIIIGVLSAIVDNIPLMFAVLTMDPQMSDGQWLLVTLTAGSAVAAVDRLGGGRGADGPGAGQSTPSRPSEMDLGHRAWLCRQHRGASGDQRRAVLMQWRPSRRAG